jgi:hypothetical protein
MKVFKGVTAMFMAIQELAKTGFGTQLEQMVTNMTFKSRGKGKGRIPGRVYHSRSKYMPHTGKQECLRRQLGGFKGNKHQLIGELS